jgi:formylglycine-generating enzyme required for sulfatase activity
MRIRRWRTALPGLFLLAAIPLGTAVRPDEGRSALDTFEKRLAATSGKPADGLEVRKLRADLLAHLQTDAGRQAGGKLLAMLSRLPTVGKSPPAPRFPFDVATAARYQREYARWLGLPLELSAASGMTFVLVPPATFRMGSPKTEAGHGAGGFDETVHEVTLTRPFYLGKHEVTVGQFRRFVEATRYITDGERNGGGHAHDEVAVWKHRSGTSWRKPGYAAPFVMKDTHPVVQVSHADSMAFGKWLGERLALAPGWACTLPSEAQWEWACRAGSASRYWWGEDEDRTGKVVNVGDRALKKVHRRWPRKTMPMDDGHAFPAPVGSYRPNAFGLCDMLGNVWEFCATHSGPYPDRPVTDPGDLDPKRGFAVRGGGWSNEPTDARCATRNADPPHFCHSNLGFRVALSIPARR